MSDDHDVADRLVVGGSARGGVAGGRGRPLDDLEGLARTKPGQREAQFMRLRDRIEERAARKFLAMEFEGTPPGIILRSMDFRK